MTDAFLYDVFLSYSSNDRNTVRKIAERLATDGTTVWFDEWSLKPGDNIPAAIEDGLERSRILVLCISKDAIASDWARLEASTFRFRDPLNKDRRFIPVRLDDAPVNGSLAQFMYISWFSSDHEQEYSKLLEACRRPKAQITNSEVGRVQHPQKTVRLEGSTPILYSSFSPSADRVLTAHAGGPVNVWDLHTGKRIAKLEGHTQSVTSADWSTDGNRILSGSTDGTVRLWDVPSQNRLRLLRIKSDKVYSVALSANQEFVISGTRSGILRLWTIRSKRRPESLAAHEMAILCTAWGGDERYIFTGSADRTGRLLDADSGRVMLVLEGHTGPLKSAAWSPDQTRLLTGSQDRTVRLWDVKTGRCLSVLEGHSGDVNSVAWSSDCEFALSGSGDRTARLWEIASGQCLGVLKGHKTSVISVAWRPHQHQTISGDFTGTFHFWDLSDLCKRELGPRSKLQAVSAQFEQVQYTNAKVLLVGESGTGKTGLSKILAGEKWEPTDSTIGAWATQWKLPVSRGNGVEREIWLWDFGGQADQRLIHQLYMEDTALAVLVFDGQKEDLFETLGQWDRDLTRASQRAFTKILAAGRIDAGGLRASRRDIETFAKERNFTRVLETSAKDNVGCTELKEAILAGIQWADIPWRSSPLLFKHLKEEILRLKDQGRVLMRFNELRDALRLRLAGQREYFKDDELKAVVGLLSGPGILWELSFGSWVLLQPERINSYAQAVIHTLRQDKYERGVIAEERVLKGDLSYQSSTKRLESEEERFVLLAMHQTLVERGLCLRVHTESGPLLIFPSYYRRERPELIGHPAVLVSYRFSGFLDDIYATLVVRLHHTQPFRQDKLWRYAADFTTLTGKQLGIKLTRRNEGSGEMEVYFDPSISVEEKIIFSRYIHEHVLQKATNVVRLRHYVCPHCGTPVGNREVAMKRLEAWLAGEGGKAVGEKSASAKRKLPTIICSNCEKRVPLWDELEECFASPELQRLVEQLQEQSATRLDNESKERALVGEVISTVALAGQISRELTVSDHGIDMEIEFKDDAGRATGRKLYLQLKSGDSYLRDRNSDGAEVFEIKKERHAEYWMAQAFPVMLVIRTLDGEIRWMEVRNWLKRASENGKKPIKQIIFEGARFDVMSVRKWRSMQLGQNSA